MHQMVRFAAPLLAAFVSVFAAAQATTYDCTPKAIAAKSAYVMATFPDYIGGKYTNKGTFGTVMSKIWDGKGDCDPSGDALAKLPPEAQLHLIKTHYYGDMMSVSALVAAKDMKSARTYMDDFNGVHGVIVGPMKQYFAGSFMTQDKDIAKAMKSFDSDITKAGYKPAP